MQRSILFTGVLLSASLSLGCDRGPSEPSELKFAELLEEPSLAAAPTKEIVREPFAFTSFIPCTGEDVSFSGEFFLTFTHVDRPNGNGFHEKLFINYRGTGIGLTSGAEYRLHEVQHGSLNDNGPARPFKDTFRIYVRISPTGPHNDFIITYRFHITINANGEITVLREQPLAFECN